MTSTIKLVIVSQDKELFKGDVEHVNVSAELGDMSIYPNHTPLLARLKPGIVSYVRNSSLEAIYISGGFVEVQGSIVSVLADVAIFGTELNEERILAAKSKAEQKLHEFNGNFDELSIKLQKEIAKLKAYQLMNLSSNKKNNK